MKISFFGGAKEVTGSNHYLEIEDTQMLVDCGLFQGSKWLHDKNFEDFNFNPQEIEMVVLTHAHLDHCGRLPKLYKEGFKGKIISTQPTKELAEIVLLDTAHIMQEECEKNKEEGKPSEPCLFDEKDVRNTMKLFETYPYDEAIMTKNARIILKDAGHILGSSFVEITTKEGTVAFSGDLGKSSVPIMKEPEKLSPVEYLITEATYGDKIHEQTKSREQFILEAINYIISHKGTLMIPAFALERTQELLFTINSLLNDKKIPQIPIFLDSPMGIETTEVFKKYTKLFDAEAKEEMRIDSDIFGFDNLKMTESRQQSQQINKVSDPKIIIAGSGMMHGGRIMHHLVRYLSDPNSYLLVVGYQVEGTLGRQILDGAKRVKIFNDWINIQAQVVKADAFSAHADQKQIVDWIAPANQSLKKVFLVHTEIEHTLPLKELLQKNTKAEIIIPELGQAEQL